LIDLTNYLWKLRKEEKEEGKARLSLIDLTNYLKTKEGKKKKRKGRHALI